MISFGPVPSRRLGKSLGVNNIPSQKICTYSCIYCQVGLTKKFGLSRENFYDPKVIFDEVRKHLDCLHEKDMPDYLTFVSNGEPTLDKNLGESIAMFQNEYVNVQVFGIVENMAWFTPSSYPDHKYYLFGSGGGKVLSKKFNMPLLAQIPIDEHVCENCDNGHLNESLKNKEIKYGFDWLLQGIHKNKTESQAIML